MKTSIQITEPDGTTFVYPFRDERDAQILADLVVRYALLAGVQRVEVHPASA